MPGVREANDPAGLPGLGRRLAVVVDPGHRPERGWAHRFRCHRRRGIGLLLGPSNADAVSRARRSSYGEVTA